VISDEDELVLKINGSLSDYDWFDWEVKDDQDILLKINSGGGDVSVFTNIFDRLRTEAKTRKVTTRCMGNCGSGAFLAFLAGDVRQAARLDSFLLHQGKTSGNSMSKATMMSMFKFHDGVKEVFISRLAEITGDRKMWEDSLLKENDQYFTGKELYDLGIVTELL